MIIRAFVLVALYLSESRLDVRLHPGDRSIGVQGVVLLELPLGRGQVGGGGTRSRVSGVWSMCARRISRYFVGTCRTYEAPDVLLLRTQRLPRWANVWRVSGALAGAERLLAATLKG
jgi:hypothetical protein